MVTNNPFESIETKLSNIESLLLALQTNQPQTAATAPDPDRWMGVDELCCYLPEKPKRGTVYTWVKNSFIPYSKTTKYLRFRKSEIDTWIHSGRRKTIAELRAETSKRAK